MTRTRSAVVALCATGSAAIVFGPPPLAHATNYYSFQSPSGNIACEMIGADDGTGAAVCKLKEHTWSAPAETGGDCEFAGTDVKLFQGHPACLGVWPSQIFLQQQNGGLPTLEYGQTHSVGAISCGSTDSGMRCTDTSTGHYFDVSLESYQLG
ncbi:hypothetical protein [[Mycobacterium] holstebronense]|uniref:Secreted protein n=1 Tax=[Mycobacterium] holstebronense TaxID=3064288 RepID=A0ABM9LYS7_9MYCO|nr:hypothetical protein [Mycolicibacter sp. MU0102]CAJ1507006.1 hypothetical protein MU0102_002926 [Mycolicibacter sp. MU0102]